MGNDFLSWLNEEMNARGWRNVDLARQALLSESTVSRVLNRERLPSADFCLSVAIALGYPISKVLGRAGLLPPEPPRNEDAVEAASIVSRLDDGPRQCAMAVLRTLAARTPPRRFIPLGGNWRGDLHDLWNSSTPEEKVEIKEFLSEFLKAEAEGVTEPDKGRKKPG